MEKILFLACTEPDGSLHKSALEALAAAKGLGMGFSAGLIGESADTAAGLATGAGAEKVYAVTGADFAQTRYATDAAAVEAIARAAGATVIITPATSRLARVAAGVAQRLGGRVDYANHGDRSQR